jgi:hypothetical protein
MRRLVVAVLTAGALALGASPAFAAQPANQACLGHDISTYAAGGADFGHFIAAVAMNATPGAGVEVQAHLAGLVPDEVLPNTCND